MTPHNQTPRVTLVQPVKLCLITRDVLTDAYPYVCRAYGLIPNERGYGALIGYRPDESKVTMLTWQPDVIDGLAHLGRDSRDGLALPDGTFPLAHTGWLDLPDACTVLTIDDDGAAIPGPAYQPPGRPEDLTP